MSFTLDSTWGRLSPNRRRVLVIIGVLGGIAGILVLAFGEPEPRAVREQRAREQLTRTLLTDVDPRALGIDGLARRLERLEQQLAATIGAVAKQDAEGSSRAIDSEVAARRAAQEAEIADLQRQVAALEATLTERRATPEPTPLARPAPSDRNGKGGESAPVPPPALDDPALFAPPGRQTPARDGQDTLHALAPNRAANPSRHSSLTIHVVGHEPHDAEPNASAAAAPAVEPVMIPAGSILRGVLLSGMDAPTGVQARRDPYPALVRLKHEAILPNRFRSDVRECFVLVAGFGELSSERAFLRTETVTCVRRDGGVIEVPLDGYAVGEDGKVGLRGRLVSKQGQVIARAMQVAFLEGVAQVFKKTPVSVFSTRADGQLQYQDLLSGDSLQAAAATGTGKTLDRLAQYYLDMAEEIFPVIEIDAGRPIELIVNRGASLQLRAPRGRRR